MSLGILNNLSALSAADNLNNTSNSLSNVLQQLSSGSKINSGADDAAGLSLVNGLQANSMALAQSKTNASQGVGLLKVADGALSQVTNLLNRAVTLATEASNGTLNDAQDMAANQEYQSILSEINNIGATTTYNGKTVFGSTTNIYTGDSSNAGASINSLNIRSLSSANVGDSNGAMSYSNGSSNVFINLSSDGKNAAVTDSLGAASATTTIKVGYMTAGANGSAISAIADISVGAGTSFANTAQGLISAINNSGLGLNASFTTAEQAGSAAVATAKISAAGGGSGSDTGIEISGVGIGSNGKASGEGVVGSLSLASGTLGGTLSFVGSDGANHNITLGKANSTDTLDNLASNINSGGYGVTATVDSGKIEFTSSNSKVSVTATNLSSNTIAQVDSPIQVAGSVVGTITVADANDTLTGTLKFTEGKDTLGTAGTDIVLAGAAGDNLAGLMAKINTDTSTTGITASLNAGHGISTDADYIAAGTILTMYKADGTTANNNTGSIKDLGTPTVNTTGITTDLAVFNNPVTGVAAGTNGTLGSITLAHAGDTVSGTISIMTADAVPVAHDLVIAAGSDQTLAEIRDTFNTGTHAADGITAVLSQDGKKLSFYQTAGDVSQPTITSATPATGLTDTTPAVTGTATYASSGSGTASLGTLTVGAKTDTLTGTFNITTKAGAPTTLSLDNKTLAEMAATINGDSSYGITATLDVAGKVLSFTATAGDAKNPTIANSGNISVTTPSVATDIKLADTPTDGVANSTKLGTLAMSGTLSGKISFGTDVNNAISIDASNNTAATLATAINAGNYGVTASVDAGIMTFTSANSAMNVVTTGLNSDSGGSVAAFTNPVTTAASTSASYYSLGISGTVADSSTLGGTANVGITTDNNGSGGIATISYSDGAGVSLASTDLSNQGNAQAALKALNSAISSVAAQDGYIGAQINTLKAVSSVLGTQQQNVIAAQNAVQATDYASAASEMSKYQILSQTGIAALAQANSAQREVTKLLQ